MSIEVVKSRLSPPREGSGWTPDGWRARRCLQQPEWPDPALLRDVTDRLATLPQLVTAAEVGRLRARLADVCRGRGFVLQAGDCAETFASLSGRGLFRRAQLLLQMSTIVAFASGLPVTTIGRIAGQLAKPRSSPVERVRTPSGTVTLPSYRGDMVNGRETTADARRADPFRLVRSYYYSAAVLNILRSLPDRGDLSLPALHRSVEESLTRRGPSGELTRHRGYLDGMSEVLRLHRSGVVTSAVPEIFTSHEALILPYEEALTRADDGGWFASSGHLLWIGERTRGVDDAHVHFAAGIANPVAVKIGPTATAAEVLALCRRLNPERIPGRLTLVTRLGAENVASALPPLVRAVRLAGEPVVWMCDPMHGNTLRSRTGLKTRRFEDVVAELRGFFAVLRAEGTHPGGIHLEVAGEDVTECVGGTPPVREEDLPLRYESACDPRLNRRQALELALVTAEMLLAGGPGAPVRSRPNAAVR